MTKRAQRRFVSDLVGSIRHDRIPFSWDGIEVPEYIADKAQRSRPAHALMGRRARDYRNHITISAGL